MRQTGGFLSDICKTTATPCTSQEMFSKFRTINGRCNNVQVIMWQIIRSGGSGFWIQGIQGFRFGVSGFQVQGFQDLEVSISWGFRVLDFQGFKFQVQGVLCFRLKGFKLQLVVRTALFLWVEKNHFQILIVYPLFYWVVTDSFPNFITLLTFSLS